MHELLKKAAGTASLKDFCSGAAKDRIVHDAATFTQCCTVIQLLAHLMDRSNQGTKLQAAPQQYQDFASELHAKIFLDSDGVEYVEPWDTRMNYRLEMVMCHHVELALHTLIRVITNRKTTNLYRLGQQHMPFLNSRLREVGLCTAYTSGEDHSRVVCIWIFSNMCMCVSVSVRLPI